MVRSTASSCSPPAGDGRATARPAAARRGAGPMRRGLARRPVPARRDLGRRRARTSRCSPRTPSASSCACSTTTTRGAHRADRAHRAQLARLPAGRRARPALRLPRPRPVRPERRPPLQPGQAAARPVREVDRGPDPLRTRPTCSPTSRRRAEDADLERDDEDDADAIPKCVVIDPRFDWEGDRPPRTPWHETVIYETHVKGFTMLHPGVREDLRGTYAGLASEEARSPTSSDLGVTAVELLPVHHIADEDFLHERGPDELLGLLVDRLLRPALALRRHRRAGPGGARVQGHGQGAAPRGHRGDPRRRLQPHRGGQPPRPDAVASRASTTSRYYRLVPDDPRYYMDFTGTGNSLNVVHPSVLRLIMDSLRYWVIECHVDGFRFDLASALRASSTTSTACRRSSTSSTRTRSSRRSS